MLVLGLRDRIYNIWDVAWECLPIHLAIELRKTHSEGCRTVSVCTHLQSQCVYYSKVSLKRDLTNLSLHCTGTVVALLVAFGMPVDSKAAGDVSIASVDIPNGACDGNVMSWVL